MSTQAATKPSLTLKRRFKAPPAKVFAAWTEPEKIKRWFGPAGAVCTHAEFDLRVGGKFTIVATGAGGETHQVLGVMREVVPGARLVYTWAWSQHSATGIAGDGGIQARGRRHVIDADACAILR